jgi:hypothetical protein
VVGGQEDGERGDLLRAHELRILRASLTAKGFPIPLRIGRAGADADDINC